MAKKPKVQAAPEIVPPIDQTPPPIKVYQGAFVPQFGFRFEDLVMLIQASGLLNTPQFYSRDERGNLVDLHGNVVVPEHLTKFFQIIEIG